jgi:glycosyltransferase involved in cell wall biosynthesis
MSRDDVRVELVGHVEVADGESVANIVREYRLDDIVTIKSHVARNESLGLALQADVVLVLTEHQPHALTYKLFEALGAGAVILNIGTDGAVAEVLRKTNRGVAVDYRKPSEIKTGILECIDRAKSRRERLEHTPWEESSIQAFNIRELTRELVRLLDKL